MKANELSLQMCRKHRVQSSRKHSWPTSSFCFDLYECTYTSVTLRPTNSQALWNITSALFFVLGSSDLFSWVYPSFSPTLDLFLSHTPAPEQILRLPKPKFTSLASRIHRWPHGCFSNVERGLIANQPYDRTIYTHAHPNRMFVAHF